MVRVADVRRLGIEGLHPAVIAAASDLFTDGHYSQAIFVSRHSRRWKDVFELRVVSTCMAVI